MTKKFLLAAPLALAAGALLTTPASAAGFANPQQIRAEIQQLDRQIERSRGLSGREEQRLQNRVDRLDSLYRSYARGGFSRSELQQLDRQLSSVKAEVYAQARDGNDRRDVRFDQHDQRGGRDGYRR